jgi:CheY-like chemotaxis protein
MAPPRRRSGDDAPNGMTQPALQADLATEPEALMAGAKVASQPSIMSKTQPIAIERRRGGQRASTRTAAQSPAAVKAILVVEDDPIQREHITGMVEPMLAHAVAVASGEEAIEALNEKRFDCVVLDLGLPGVSGWEVIDHVRGSTALGQVPLIVYTARDLTRKEELRLGKATKSIVIKEVRSPERLREEIVNLLALPTSRSPPRRASRTGIQTRP